jgi:outer membrane lipoprotein-sorting protein
MMNQGECFVRHRMSKSLILAIPAMAAALMLMPLTSPAQTVDEVIARNIQAHGGMDKLKAVKSIKISQTLKAGGFQAAVYVEGKRPDKVRVEFSLQGLTQLSVYDGKIGWQVNPFGGRRDPELLSADDMKSLQVDADIDGPLVDYAQKGHQAELLGHDSVEGTDCYKIKLRLKNGDVRTYYLDADSFLELKIETQTTIRGAVQEGETFFGDYEKVDGLYFPFAIEQGQKGDPNRVKLTVNKVELNVPLDDSLFTMPATPGAKPDAKGPDGAK